MSKKKSSSSEQPTESKTPDYLVRSDLHELKAFITAGFEHVTQQLGERLDRIEFNTAGLERRISTAEDRIRQLATKAGLEFN